MTPAASVALALQSSPAPADGRLLVEDAIEAYERNPGAWCPTGIEHEQGQRRVAWAIEGMGSDVGPASARH